MSRRYRKALWRNVTRAIAEGRTALPGFAAERPQGHRGGGKPAARFPAPRAAKPPLTPPSLPRKSPNRRRCRQGPDVVVTADENNMRVDRFLEARFPGLSSLYHIQRIGSAKASCASTASVPTARTGWRRAERPIPPLKLDARGR